MSDILPQVAIAILYRENKFLMQLRDDIPGIAYPGHWAFFGGHIEPNEQPEDALKRELLEEIGYIPDNPSFFSHYSDNKVFRHVYHAPLTVELNQLILGEGWDMGLLTPQEILTGERYSEKAGQVRPLGRPHQLILLDFIEASKSFK
jgi:8-oxo-dGTP diphosphatase